MLDAKELKVVLSTLTQRRAWLLKALEGKDVDEAQKQEHLATIRVIDSSMQKLSKSAPAKPAARPKPTPAPPPPLAQKKPVRKKRSIEPAEAYALIAEDNPDSATLLKDVLEDMGIKKIEVASDGRQAYYALQNCSPPFDIVLCDWDMPEMNGIEVRKAVKSLAKLQDTHFIMVTAVSETARIKEAIIHGINDYIVKPVDIQVLEGKIMAALKGSEPEAPKEEVLLKKSE